MARFKSFAQVRAEQEAARVAAGKKTYAERRAEHRARAEEAARGMRESTAKFKQRMGEANRELAEGVRATAKEAREQITANNADFREKIGERRDARRFSTATDDGKCPNCGGSSWTAKRSGIGKVSLGVLAPKTRVRCTGCGAEFIRS